jgi:N-acyl-D-aspartate/D-glutamate deacylase
VCRHFYRTAGQPTEEDIAAMQTVVRQAVQAGAMGIGSNRVGGHSDLSGNR